MKEEYLYRYEFIYHFEKVDLFCNNLIILSRTPKGVWVESEYGKRKLVYPGARNSYAQLTKREALKHFVRRKSYRNHCIESELERNNKALIQAKNLIREHDKQRKESTTKKSS